MIYFDKFETWGASFEIMIKELIGQAEIDFLSSSDFEYIEDAGAYISQLTGLSTIASKVRDWITCKDVCVFHGTRLLPKELETLKRQGLQPLVARDRQNRLTQIFQNHSDWRHLEQNLSEIIDDVGLRQKDGRREAQVHFSISRSGLENGFDHYLTHGSEFDQRVAQRLFVDGSGLQLLSTQTKPYLVHVKMSGTELIQGTQPYFSYQDVINMDDIPHLATTLLNAWAFKKSKPSFEISSLRTDCCMVQKTVTRPKKIVSIEALS